MKVMKHRVRYNEVDAQGIVFNAHYLTWCDNASYEFFRKKGWSPHELASKDFDFVVRSANIDYREPAYLDDLLDIDLYVKKIGVTSYHVVFNIMRNETILAVVKMTHINIKDKQSYPIPEEIKSYLNESLFGTCYS